MEETNANVTKTYTDPVTGKFIPGNPGGGRPAGVRSFTTKVKEALEKIADGKDYSYEEAFVKAILKKAIVDQDPAIMKLIWNYLDGMPLQRGELTGKDGAPIPLLHNLKNVHDNNSNGEDSAIKEEN